MRKNEADSKKSRRVVYTVIAAANAAALIVFALLSLLLNSITGTLSSQSAAQRWASDSKVRYAQLSAFFSAGASVDVNSVYTMRVDIDKKLMENSLKAEKDGARLWIDAFSAETELDVRSTKEYGASTVTAEVVATGGDFFVFHPLELKSGYYYSDNDLMKDRIIIDENLAWQLFGSDDIDGMTVIINGRRFYIAGVIKNPSDSASEAVNGEKPRMYMSYDAYCDLNDGTLMPVTCYEACLPNPVKELGKSVLTSVIKADEDYFIVMENSSRYSIPRLFNLVKNFDKRGVLDAGAFLPFWEDAARITENRAALVFALIIVSLILPICTIIFLIGLIIHNRKLIFTDLLEAVKKIRYNIKREKIKAK